MRHFLQQGFFSDSSFTVGLVERLHHCDDPWEFHEHGDFDLILRLHACLTPTHVVCKIKAHRDLLNIPLLLDTYAALGNHVADMAAVQAGHELFPPVAQQLEQYHQEHMLQLDMLSQLYHLELILQRVRAQSQEEPNMPVVAQNTVSKGSKTYLLDSVRAWQPVSDWNFPETFTNTWLRSCAWGQHAAWSLIEWLQSCRWPNSDEGPQGQSIGMAWTEVAVAVACQHRQWLPVKRKDASGTEYLYQPKNDEDAKNMAITLSEQSENICYLLKHLRSMVPENLLPDVPLGKVNALMVYGFGAWTTGFRWRPCFPGQAKVADILLAHIPNADSQLSQLPEIQWHGPFRPWDDDVTLSETPFPEKQRLAKSIMRLVRQKRKELEDN